MSLDIGHPCERGAWLGLPPGAAFGLRITGTAPLTYPVPGPVPNTLFTRLIKRLLLVSKEINSSHINFFFRKWVMMHWWGDGPLTPRSGGRWPQERPRVRTSEHLAFSCDS